MEEKFDIKNYEDALQKEDYESIYIEIVNKSIELANKLAKIKNIELDSKEDLEDKLYTIKFAFNRESASFRGIIYLMKDLIEWYCDDIYEEEIFLDYEEILGEENKEEEDSEKSEKLTPIETKEQKILRYMRRYNLIVYELEQYYSIEKEINENGYDKLIEQRKEKLIQVFKEMLEFKNKEYDENWNLQQFAEKISQYYNFYSEELWNTISAANMGSVSYDIEEDSIRINEVESIMFVDDFLEELTNEDDDYKKYANFYRDFELEEGQSFKDLYNKEIEKFIKLFKDMLDYRNIEYNKDEKSFDKLKWKVMEYYPYYHAMLFHLISPNPNTTYIQELDSMENVYETISNEYKNHEENLIKYKDYMELLRKEGYDLDNKYKIE